MIAAPSAPASGPAPELPDRIQTAETTGSDLRCDILVVEDDAAVATLLENTLRRQGHRVRRSCDGHEAMAYLRRNPVRLVITDIFMPESDGLDLIIKLTAFNPSTAILAISGGSRIGGPESYLKLARLLGCRRTLAKPFELPQLLAVVDELLV